MRIDTARLALTELTDADAEFIRGLLNEPSFLRYIGDRGVRTVEDAKRYVREGPAAMYAKFGYGLLRVGLGATGTPIGICGVLKRDTLPDPDLGFSLLPAYWSQGYAFEAADAVMRDARGRLHLGRILAITSPDNESSIRLLGRLGFRFEHMMKLQEGADEVRLFVNDP
jgi:RimJ/RimL family protein N-acetyltransferase